MDTVRQILDRKGNAVWSIAPGATVYEAVELMAEKGIGALMVVSDGRLSGVMSERDYARKVILKGRSSHEVRVAEIMSHPVISVTPDHTRDECLRIASLHRIRHLPVLDGEALVGVVSMGDLVKAIIEQQQQTIEHLTNYIGGKYPA